MMSQGGQQFQTAYANLQRYLGCATSAAACGASVPAAGTAAYTSYISSAPAQAFFESALKASGYCTGTRAARLQFWTGRTERHWEPADPTGLEHLVGSGR